MNVYAIAGACALVVGAFFYGQHTKDNAWQARWEARNAADAVAQAEAYKREREKEQEWQKKLEEIQNAGKKYLEDLRKRERDAAASRMRDAIEAARRRASEEAAANLRSQASPVDVFAELLTGADELAEKFAREADESRIRGAACEAAYDATR